MKKIIISAVVVSALAFASCTKKLSSMSKHSVAFPGMTVTRADYKLSKEAFNAEVEVKEFYVLRT